MLALIPLLPRAAVAVPCLEVPRARLDGLGAPGRVEGDPKPFHNHSLWVCQQSSHCVVPRCDFPGLAVLGPAEPGEWLLCQGSCGSLREMTVTMLLSWLYLSLEGGNGTATSHSSSSAFLCRRMLGHTRTLPHHHICCCLGKIQVCSSTILCSKSSGSFPKC